MIILGRRDIACGLSRLYLDATSQQCAVSRNRNSVTVAPVMIMIMIFTVLIKKYDGDNHSYYYDDGDTDEMNWEDASAWLLQWKAMMMIKNEGSALIAVGVVINKNHWELLGYEML